MSLFTTRGRTAGIGNPLLPSITSKIAGLLAKAAEGKHRQIGSCLPVTVIRDRAIEKQECGDTVEKLRLKS